MGKESACNVGVIGVIVRFPGQEDSLEEGMATYSSILAWKISWSERLAGVTGVHGDTKGQT